MIQDKQLMLSDGQTGITSTAASTNIYDAGAQGDAIGSKLWIVVRVKTSLTSGASTGTVSAQLETADDASFSTNKTTLLATGAIIVTTAVAGYVFMKAVVPLGMREFIRINYVVATDNLTGGAFDAFLTSDVDALLNY